MYLYILYPNIGDDETEDIVLNILARRSLQIVRVASAVQESTNA